MTDLSRLPQIDVVLRHPAAEDLVATYGHRPTADAVRRAVAAARDRARRGGVIPRVDEIVSAAGEDLGGRARRRLTGVINATGVILHTNLGRAPLSVAARAAIEEASGYCTLEFDRESGRRGSRVGHVGEIAAEACSAEAATVVNNGAAAVVLVLAALAHGREAVVSRGELVEIGGSFRLPDIMAASGAIMREVGTTNRTRIEDYRAAIGDHTGVVLKVHRSNYRVVGFATEPSSEEVAEVARENRVPFVHDIGSGLLREIPANAGGREAFATEPSAESALRAGADLVVFSGDKLLGGPQAGIIAGRSDLVLRCDRHPLARALRLDKLRRAALESTLESHLKSDVPTDLPVWAMLASPLHALRARAEAIAAAIGGPARATQVTSLTGGGSLPGAELPSWAVAVDVERPDDLARKLRQGTPPVVGRVDQGVVVLDLRTVPPAQDDGIEAALRTALATG